MVREILGRITEFACSRTPTEWWNLIHEAIERVRVLVRDNGEKAAIVGFGLGMLLIIFFKLIVLLFVVGALVFLSLVAISEHHS